MFELTINSLSHLLSNPLFAQGEAESAGVAAVFIMLIACWGISILIGIAMFAFWVWMLIDCITKEPPQGNDKLTWILVLVLAGGIGALVYYFVRRPTRIRMYGA